MMDVAIPAPARPVTKAPLPTAYRIWVSGAVVSILGDGVLYFALGWTATGHSGALAGLVLTAVNLPRALLLLVGGAVGDRVGARRVLIAGDAAMTGLCLILALVLLRTGPAVGILLLTGLILGTVDAFCLPASGSMSRLLVPPEQLPRALGLRQAGGQVAQLAAGPIGGVLVLSAGLSGVLVLDAVTFAVVLAALLRIRPLATSSNIAPNTAAKTESLVAAARDGFRAALADPVLRTLLLLTGAVAGLVLPTFSILVPLLARDHDWSARGAGSVVGAQALGMIAVALAIAHRGASSRAGPAAAGGVVLAAAGLVILALAPGTVLAVLGAAVAGAGTGVFAGHAAPTVLAATPHSHLSRVQAMLMLAQTLTLLVTNNGIGAVADLAGAAPGTLLAAAALLVSGLLALSSRAFREA
jgi:hypothetical protein